MKKIISGLLIASFVTFNIFPTDKFDRIANKTCKSVTGKELGLSTGAKIGLGALAVAAVAGAVLLASDSDSDNSNSNTVVNDKYTNIANKAYSAITK